jgi:Ser/Thr protein kinase RdoA (MazF antagonist)
MIAYECLTEEEQSHRLRRLAEQALERYGLGAAHLTLFSLSEDTTFFVEVPFGDGSVVHPYLGRIEGKQFALRVLDAGEENAAAALADIVWLARLLRDTSLVVPEPVPACDGSLVVEVPGEPAMPNQFVLLRWAGGGSNEEELIPEEMGEYIVPPWLFDPSVWSQRVYLSN